MRRRTESEATARCEFVDLDPDTFTSRDSAEAARLAAGALVDLVGRFDGGGVRQHSMPLDWEGVYVESSLRIRETQRSETLWPKETKESPTRLPLKATAIH
jgi:hypothetical protein